MYKALIRFEEGESRLVQMLETYVDEVGSNALKQVCEAAKTVSHLFYSFLGFVKPNAGSEV